MEVCLNGNFVAEAAACVSVFDRSFLYGDGLFETLRVVRGRPFRWAQHVARLRAAARFCGIIVPFEDDDAKALARELSRRNQLPDALLRLNLSRGLGPRGYSPRGADQPLWVMSVHPAPAVDPDALPQWRLKTSQFRLQPGDPLARIKSCNRLVQVLAKAEALESGMDEALLLNTRQEVVEGAASNLFWIEAGRVHTPPLSNGALAGVTRECVMEIGRAAGIGVLETTADLPRLHRAEGVFMTLSSLGLVEVTRLDDGNFARAPQSGIISRAYWARVLQETLLG